LRHHQRLPQNGVDDRDRRRHATGGRWPPAGGRGKLGAMTHAIRQWSGLAALLCVLFPAVVRGQTSDDTRTQYQFWWSLNSTLRFSESLGAVADVHIRRTDFMANPSFNFVRVGGQYWLTERLTLVVGYAHLWQAPGEPGWTTWTQEDRVYQQLQYVSGRGRVGLLQRLRVEQRWKDAVADDQLTGEHLFSNRIRYLFSVTAQVSPNRNVPALVISDEIHASFGPQVANNFDQNRLFGGIKQRVTGSLSFDLGYMMVYQQKPTGSRHDLNHTLRWYFYYAPDFRRKPAGARLTS
jgi:hypothetical protein